MEDEETAGQTGAYAREMSEAFRQKQAELMATTIAKNDIVICTALVMGRQGAGHRHRSRWSTVMRPGSVIVDLAADAGGNCAATVPGERIVTPNGVTVLGYHNWPGRIPVAASCALCAQPADLPHHVLGQGSEGAEAAGERRHREGRHADPRRRRRASELPALASCLSSRRSTPMNPNQLADEADAARSSGPMNSPATRTRCWPSTPPAVVTEVEPFVFLLAIFLMACFVGYYVVWNVTPALHSPLMAVTNAISSVIVVGAMLATGLGTSGWAMGFGFIAVMLASVNIFGGFVVTQRMLSMFKKTAIEDAHDVRQPHRARLSGRRRPVHPGAARAVVARSRRARATGSA